MAHPRLKRRMALRSTVRANLHSELVAKAQLEALQAQIRPHFLFNTLNTILIFSYTDVPRAQQLLIKLAEFFRVSLGNRGHMIPLMDELEYLSTYLCLEQARFGDNLKVHIRVEPEVMGIEVPVLTLQPLVENAILHGLAPKENGGALHIRARRLRGELRITIADTGLGMDAEARRRALAPGLGTGSGIGMNNVNDRLRALYGHRYGLRVKSSPGRGTVVVVRIPLR